MTFDLGVIRRQHLKQNQAKGGVKYVAGNYAVHAYSTSSTLTTLTTVQAEVLVVAGGGGGAQYGSGGGAGGVILGTYTFNPGTYTVTVGSGGLGQLGGTPATKGNDSSIVGPGINLVALGGGAAAAGLRNGGSGAGSTSSQGGAGLQPGSASGGLGNNGGGTATVWASGGGGGAGEPGLPPIANSPDTTSLIGGQGGRGIASDISGTMDYYAGGGGGQAYIYARGFDGPYYGWARNAPIPSYYGYSYDADWINGHSITDRYNPQPFTVTVYFPATTNYIIKWYVGGVNGFRYTIGNNTYYHADFDSMVKQVRYRTISVAAGLQSVTIDFDSVYQYSRPTYYRGHIAFAIYTVPGFQVWSSTQYAIETGGYQRYGGGGRGFGQDSQQFRSGGSGVVYIRYNNI